MLAPLTRAHTLVDVLDGPAYASVEGSGVSGALESQPELLVVDSPVVEDGIHLVVNQVFLQDALQDHLQTHTHSGEREREIRHVSKFPG